MAAAGVAATAFWKDEEIVVDRDGVPHFTGAQPALMKEYRRRVLFAFNSLEGSGDDDIKEKRSLEKKQKRFAGRLLQALHGEAYKACADLMLDPEKLRNKDGYNKIFRALGQIEKAGIIRKTEAFDQFFDKCYRRKGQAIDSYLRQRKQDWDDLCELGDGIKMSEDLLAYFTLKNVNLGKDDKRQILLANQSAYSLEGIEKALRVSFYDVHEREKAAARDWHHAAGPRKEPGNATTATRTTPRSPLRMMARSLKMKRRLLRTRVTLPLRPGTRPRRSMRRRRTWEPVATRRSTMLIPRTKRAARSYGRYSAAAASSRARARTPGAAKTSGRRPSTERRPGRGVRRAIGSDTGPVIACARCEVQVLALAVALRRAAPGQVERPRGKRKARRRPILFPRALSSLAWAAPKTRRQVFATWSSRRTATWSRTRARPNSMTSARPESRRSRASGVSFPLRSAFLATPPSSARSRRCPRRLPRRR